MKKRKIKQQLQIKGQNNDNNNNQFAVKGELQLLEDWEENLSKLLQARWITFVSFLRRKCYERIELGHGRPLLRRAPSQSRLEAPERLPEAPRRESLAAQAVVLVRPPGVAASPSDGGVELGGGVGELDPGYGGVDLGHEVVGGGGQGGGGVVDGPCAARGGRAGWAHPWTLFWVFVGDSRFPAFWVYSSTGGG